MKSNETFLLVVGLLSIALIVGGIVVGAVLLARSGGDAVGSESKESQPVVVFVTETSTPEPPTQPVNTATATPTVVVVAVTKLSTQTVVATTVTSTRTPSKYGGALRIVSQGSIATLDPVFSLFYVVNAVASHIYESLFGWDENFEVKPRAVDNWSVSSDGMEYTFSLRQMTFHDGSAFESIDAARSIFRWREGGTPGATMLRNFTGSFSETVTIIDDDTFRFRLTEPLGALIPIFGQVHGLMPMMRAGDANRSWAEPVPETIGTGAYRLLRWVEGDRVVLLRWGDYVSREETAVAGVHSGRTISYLDTLTWLEVLDEETQVSGLESGVWDVVDVVTLDYYERLVTNPDLQVVRYAPGNRSNAYLNPQIAPFNSLRARQAIQTAIDVEEFMLAIGPQDVWITCSAVYWCGTNLETSAGERYDVTLADGSVIEIGYNVNDIDTARRLMAESGYSGETAVILNPTDYASITELGSVLKESMESLGIVAEMPSLDWATVVTMFGDLDSYSAATDWYSHWCCGNPIQDHLISGTLGFIIDDEELQALQMDYAREEDAAERFAIVEEIQRQRYEKVTSLLFGVHFPIVPARADLQFFEVKSIPFFGNTWIER
ncbi:MAG: ABC transporter substrate-binding protein [Chloroflexi bacterium]|nr:ABC transporter substrate-binding protein [Chloroflexota bacterium]